MNQIDQRRAAAAAGQSRFNTGKPCKRGHFADRYTVNGACTECMKATTVTQVAISRELVTWQPQSQQIAHDLLPQLRAALDDVVADAVEKWHADMGMATQGRVDAWKRLRFGRAQKAKLTAYQAAHSGPAMAPPPVPAVPAAPATAPSGPISGPDAFLAALDTMTGAALDGATELIRQQGEPDVHFRKRVRAQTLKNLGRL